MQDAVRSSLPVSFVSLFRSPLFIPSCFLSCCLAVGVEDDKLLVLTWCVSMYACPVDDGMREWQIPRRVIKMKTSGRRKNRRSSSSCWGFLRLLCSFFPRVTSFLFSFSKSGLCLLHSFLKLVVLIPLQERAQGACDVRSGQTLLDESASVYLLRCRCCDNHIVRPP